MDGSDIVILALIVIVISLTLFYISTHFKRKSSGLNKMDEYWKYEAELSSDMSSEDYKEYLKSVDDGTIKRRIDLERDPKRAEWDKRNYH